MELEASGLTFTGLNRINVVLGKNGCGKSTILKKVSNTLRGQSDQWGTVKYITPERGGVLKFEMGIESSIRMNPQWLITQTEKNQFSQFKQQTFYQFERLRLETLQKYVDASEAGDTPARITYLSDINSLLDNIEIKDIKGEKGFKIHLRSNDDEVSPEQISSGESELISLAIECLVFEQTLDADKNNILILDEPDVHLHPDLQGRLMGFINRLVERHPSVYVLIATHSTAILGELAQYSHTAVAPMKANQTRLEFESIDDAYKQILPVFGAHPLTSVFREKPLLLVEGTDEERVWQQAVRTSQGRIHLYPIETGGIGDMPKYEGRAAKVASAVYDNATFYSLRDRDDRTDEPADAEPIVRLMLSCRASENLLLSNEVLARAGTNWEEIKARIQDWLTKNPDHSRSATMKAFAADGFKRKTFDLKDLRILMVDLMGSDKPWEVLVGQAIGDMTESQLRNRDEGTLANFMGDKISSILINMIS